mmetsp:Transcript_33211/g.58589  ORF Transcript_33211/g.58589 Transcript_33211/m.58589 type:complete len:226 (-) Transcript_33211:176-853(-)
MLLGRLLSPPFCAASCFEISAWCIGLPSSFLIVSGLLALLSLAASCANTSASCNSLPDVRFSLGLRAAFWVSSTRCRICFAFSKVTFSFSARSSILISFLCCISAFLSSAYISFASSMLMLSMSDSFSMSISFRCSRLAATSAEYSILASSMLTLSASANFSIFISFACAFLLFSSASSCATLSISCFSVWEIPGLCSTLLPVGFLDTCRKELASSISLQTSPRR